MPIFRFFKMAAAAILDFQILKFSRSERCRVPSCVTVPNFVKISQTAAEIWQFLDFSKMVAVHHLGFVMRVFGPPTKAV